MKQTAMEQLFDNLQSIDITVPIGIKKIFLEKEKQQIEDAYFDGKDNMPPLTEEEYYNRTFKQE